MKEEKKDCWPHNFVLQNLEKEIWHYGKDDAEWRDFCLILCSKCGLMKKKYTKDIISEEIIK
jgi:hypothetical protein